ncbi:glycine-rich cell wall structural protein 1.0-like [Cryptomeria japonica]|uniref:glycine-rich cell wall structural protein 1.0-like n=1 Tax=Cryptomeria japonica TaxID=3369 RepID=UPI0027DA03F4|nr:glycine-rich cell wall structural protein 1.0-like [Cryptomeria japonica]
MTISLEEAEFERRQKLAKKTVTKSSTPCAQKKRPGGGRWGDGLQAATVERSGGWGRAERAIGGSCEWSGGRVVRAAQVSRGPGAAGGGGGAGPPEGAGRRGAGAGAGRRPVAGKVAGDSYTGACNMAGAPWAAAQSAFAELP